MTGDRTPTGDLRERLAEAIRAAAHVCSEDCDGEGLHPIMATSARDDRAVYVEGRPGDLAAAVLPVVEDETGTLTFLLRKTEDELHEARQRAEEAEAKVAALMDERGAEQVDRIQADRDALPEDERVRLDAADAPMLRIQLAGMARQVAEAKAEVDRTATAAAREIWVKFGFDTILMWKGRAETAERERVEALAAVQRVRPAIESAQRGLATTSRDMGVDRTDAWLYAVFLGWDCERDHEHTDDCDAMTEVADTHGWDPATVARLREYRAALAALEPPEGT